MSAILVIQVFRKIAVKKVSFQCCNRAAFAGPVA